MIFFYSCLFSLVSTCSFIQSEDETIVFLKDKIKSFPNDSVFYNAYLNLYKSENSKRDKNFYANILILSVFI